MKLIFRRWLIRLFWITFATLWVTVIVGSFWWALIAIVSVIVLYLVAIWILLYLQNVKGRQVFYTMACPACQKRYEREDVRQAKHLVKSQVLGGPPPASFSAQFYEAWELRCGACGHVQDFDPTGNIIVVEQQQSGEDASSAEVS
jgi:hypothetical protein